MSQKYMYPYLEKQILVFIPKSPKIQAKGQKINVQYKNKYFLR